MYDQDPKQCLTSNIIFEDPRDPLYCNSVISSSGKCKMCNNHFRCVQTSQHIPLPPRPKTCTRMENWLKSSEPVTSHQTTRGMAQSDYRTLDFIWCTYTAMPVQFISHPNVVQIASRTDSSLTRVIVDVVLESQLCCQDSHGYLFL